jgi:hypothetical protein
LRRCRSPQRRSSFRRRRRRIPAGNRRSQLNIAPRDGGRQRGGGEYRHSPATCAVAGQTPGPSGVELKRLPSAPVVLAYSTRPCRVTGETRWTDAVVAGVDDGLSNFAWPGDRGAAERADKVRGKLGLASVGVGVLGVRFGGAGANRWLIWRIRPAGFPWVG